MKYLIPILLFISIKVSAQYGNEWINYNQKYYSFKIWEEGIYSLDSSTLANAGLDLSTIDPRNIQIFGREKEIPIKITGESDGVFNGNDLIEFYAKGNDAWLDSLMFEPGAAPGNPAYSLYNDTIHYFLTWNTSTNNKRVVNESNLNHTAYTPSDYLWRKSEMIGSDRYNQGKVFLGTSSSRFIDGEGFSYGTKNASSSQNSLKNLILQIPTRRAFKLAGTPDSEIYAIAASLNSVNNSDSTNPDHHLQIKIYDGSGFLTLEDTIYSGYKCLRLNALSPSDILGNNTTQTRLALINDLGVNPDLQTGTYVSLTYPRLPHFDNNLEEGYYLPQDNDAYKLYNFQGVPGTAPRAWVFGDSTKEVSFQLNGTWDALLPNSSSKRLYMYYFDNSAVNPISQVNAVGSSAEFTDISIMDSAYIIVYPTELSSSAQQYLNYRQSVSNGVYTPVLVPVEDLYLQFGGGIEKHALALKRFFDYYYDNAGQKPHSVFLMGKGIREAALQGEIDGARTDPAQYALNLMPSFGYPSSDFFLVNGLNDALPDRQDIPIGRLAARNDTEVLDYLNKVQDYESAQNDMNYALSNKEWMKQVLHFSGGGDSWQQNTFQFYLSNYEEDVEDSLFGGNVSMYAKTTGDPIDPSEFQEIQDLIENGVSLITFFGHGSINGFDQNLEQVSDWDNQGKYPFLIANSCYTGNIYEPGQTSQSEEFILIPNEGVVGYCASTKLGFSSYLNLLCGRLYENFSTAYYHYPFAYSLMKAKSSLQNQGYLADGYDITFSQYAFHGDPALKLNTHPRPEFHIDQNSVFIQPSNIDLSTDSITVGLVVHNLGAATGQEIVIEMDRLVPGNNQTFSYDTSLIGSYYKDTVLFKIPLLPNLGSGLNTFTFRVDQPSYIDEAADETFNNQTVFNFPINLEGARPIWPYEFAIYPEDTVTLKASTVNPLSPNRNYIFEIDTVDFEEAASPFKRYCIINSDGGVIESNNASWQLSSDNSPSNLFLDPMKVYYWRISIDSVDKAWNESSFQYIPDRWGWGQSHFFQYKDDEFNLIEYDRPNRLLKFGDLKKSLNVTVYGNANNGSEYNGTEYLLNNSVEDGDYGICTTNPSIHVAVIDPLELKPWENNIDGNNPQNDFGDVTTGCSSSNYRFFIFRQNNPTHMDSLESMIRNKIPDNHYVLIYSARFADFDQWENHSPEIQTLFEDLGSTLIDTNSIENLPFISFYKQGDPLSYREEVGTHLNDTIYLADTLSSNSYFGSVKTNVIGPVSEWHNLYFGQNNNDAGLGDTNRIRLYGLDHAFNETLVLDTIYVEEDSIVNLASYGFLSSLYPYAKLEFTTQDTAYTTPLQADYWRLTFDPVPELALNPKEGYYLSKSDDLTEGEGISLAVAITNVSPFDFDSLMVNYYFQDENNQRNYFSYPLQTPLLGHQSFIDTVNFTTAGFPNSNLFWMEANPIIGPGPSQQHQDEEYYFNNLLQIPFNVDEDIENPILDVVFDGIHILDGDIVSPRPEIVISLKDENPFMLLNEDTDTSNFHIYLKEPNGFPERLYFMDGAGNEILEWLPAVDEKNLARIRFRGEFLQDGIYELHVQGSDKGGNISGDLDYKISFEVVLEQTITEVLNYPNPFSTRTQFVFTLTGEDTPENIKIQIMTVTGKVVREINQDELGQLRIGRNRTEFWWDGTDEFGDPLANGVYLYRVFVQSNGEDVKLRETSASQYFKKGFGKMYLMR
jgi:hypothetical protein